MIYINTNEPQAILTIPRGSAPKVPEYKLHSEFFQATFPGTFTIYPDKHYDGFSDVNVNASYEFYYPQKTINVTTKETYTVEGPMDSLKVHTDIPPRLQEMSVELDGDIDIEAEEGYDGISKVTVKTQPTALHDIDGMKYAESSIVSFPNDMVFAKRTGANAYNMFNNCSNLRSLPQSLYIKDCTSADYMFNNCSNITEINLDAIPQHASYMFSNCSKLQTINFIGAPVKHYLDSASNMFRYCPALKKESWIEILKRLDLEDVSNFNYTFSYCKNLFAVSKSDLGETLQLGRNVEKVSYENAFDSASMGSLTTDDWCIEIWNGTNFIQAFYATDITNTNFWHSSNKPTQFKQTFQSCNRLKDVSLIDLTNCVNASNAFAGCVSLENLKGFPGLARNLDLSSSPKLTHESLMNVMNNLADVKSVSYGPVTLTLGETNLAKLTDDEKKIATDKGWTLK